MVSPPGLHDNDRMAGRVLRDVDAQTDFMEPAGFPCVATVAPGHDGYDRGMRDRLLVSTAGGDRGRAAGGAGASLGSGRFSLGCC